MCQSYRLHVTQSYHLHHVHVSQSKCPHVSQSYCLHVSQSKLPQVSQSYRLHNVSQLPRWPNGKAFPSPTPHPLPPPFPWLSPTRDLKTGSLVATLPGTWHYRVSAGTGWAGGYPARHLALQGQCWDWLGWWLPCQAPGITVSAGTGWAGGYPARHLALQGQCWDWLGWWLPRQAPGITGSVLGLVGLVATLPGTWHYRVSAGTGWAGGYPARHLALQGQCWDWLGWWLPCQAPGIAGSVLGLVGYPARQMASQGQRWDWLGWCPYTVTG